MPLATFAALASDPSSDHEAMRDRVAALLRARTKTKGGIELGRFSSETRPTADQVDSLIDEAVLDVVAQIGVPEAGSRMEEMADGAAVLLAAILVESSYFPEQVANGRSVVETYQKLYASRMKSLVSYVEQGGDDGDADGAAGSADADLSFDTQVVVDDVVYGLPPIGWATRW